MIQLRAIITLLWIFVALPSIVWSTKIRWTKYEYEDASNGFTCATTEYLFIRDDVPDSFACSKICFMHRNCLTADSNPDKFKCIGCTVFSFQHPPWSENLVLLSRRDCHIDCKDVLTKNEHVKSGVYEIRLNILEKIDVYCDMEGSGGGWTIFQKRCDGSVDFNKTFEAYEDGFGDIDGEFWLGLNYLQELTVVPSNMIVTAVLKPDKGEIHEYNSFKLIGENYDVFAVTSAETPLSSTLNRAPFYTYDKDTQDGCAQSTGGGWWFHKCDTVNFNGEHQAMSSAGLPTESSMRVRRP